MTMLIRSILHTFPTGARPSGLLNDHPRHNTYTYDAYGNLTASTGTLAKPLQYAGQYVDSESGLYYLRARYQDPGTGQFVSADPARPTTLEPYACVSGNPLNNVDPTGLCGTMLSIVSPQLCMFEAVAPRLRGSVLQAPAVVVGNAGDRPSGPVAELRLAPAGLLKKLPEAAG